MKHKTISYFLFFICVALGYGCNAPSASGREVLDMNTDWAFYRGDVTEGSRMDACRPASYHAIGNETLRRKLHL